jgi:hypothetical protein
MYHRYLSSFSGQARLCTHTNNQVKLFLYRFFNSVKEDKDSELIAFREFILLLISSLIKF